MQNKLALLKKKVKSYKRAVVAYSGGVDSSFLLKVTHEALGRNNSLAVTV